MKQIILSLFALCSTFAVQAQSCVTIQQVSTNYDDKQITFDLKWGTCNNTNHLYRVWVFVDYRPIMGETLKGTWTRAGIAGSDTGEVHPNNGVWITGTANVTQRVTLTLNITAGKFDWCAFATDYPPIVYFPTPAPTAVVFGGTAPFSVTYNDGTVATVSDKTYTPATGKTITAMTDATGCPGVIASVATNQVTGANTEATNYSTVYTLNGTNSIFADERGFVYSSSNSTPTIESGTKLTVAAGASAMSYNLPTNTYLTTFYVRAYAIRNNTVLYGNATNFKTWGPWYGHIRWNTGVCYGSWGMTSHDNWAAWPCITSVPAHTYNSQWQFLQNGAGSVCLATSGSWYWSSLFAIYAVRCTQQDNFSRPWVLYSNRTR